MFRGILGRTHVALSRSRIAVGIALKIRNQCEMILGRYLGQESRRSLNGEQTLLQLIAPTARTFLDVGANVGEWTELFLRAGEETKLGILIEPSGPAYARLKVLFGSKTNIHLIHAAVSDQEGEAEFHEEADSGETSSLVSSWSVAGARTVTVPVTTIDQEVARAGWSTVDVLKIDTEGYDLHAIQGARQLLNTKSIGILQFEYNAPWAQAGSTLAAAITLLEGYGYKVFLLRTTGLHPLNYARWGEYYFYSNFIAVSPQMMPLVDGLVRYEV